VFDEIKQSGSLHVPAPQEESTVKLVPPSEVVETPRLQAEKVLGCRGATCHSGESRNPAITVFVISGCRIKSGMTTEAVRSQKLILINSHKTPRLEGEGCSVPNNS